MRLRHVLGLTFVSGLLLVAHPRQVMACGGCFIPPLTNMSTVVTGHRMAFAFSSTRTVLWDQIQYSGSPADFSWVLPVKGDTDIEAAEDAWFEALESVTNTVVTPPHLDCYSQSGSGGCDCGSVSESAVPTSSAGGVAFGAGNGVTVLHQGTVGPYDDVRLRSTTSGALITWLTTNGYNIPADIKPVIEAYQHEGFDFFALRLQPDKTTQQMTPVRVITQGASVTLPLRMVAAGTGDFVGITLYVIAEGRYEAADFNNKVNVDFSQLAWDWHGNIDTSQGTSNYGALRLQALATGDGRNWLTTFAAKGAFTKTFVDALGQNVTFNTTATATPGGFTGEQFKNLTELYFGQASKNNSSVDICSTPSSATIASHLNDHLQVVDTCPHVDSNADASNAPDAAALGDSGSDAAVRFDAGIKTPAMTPQCTSAPLGSQAASGLICNGFSDIAAATIGMFPDDVWITRLEANLPHAALATDLKLKPATDQTNVSNARRAVQHINPPCDLLSNHPDIEITASTVSPDARMQQAGVGAFTALGLLVARRASRRRARRT